MKVTHWRILANGNGGCVELVTV